MKTLLLIAFYFICTFDLHAQEQKRALPNPEAGSCQFYDLLEQRFHCREKGVNYLSDYAPFYCKEFNKEGKNWSLALKKWARNTRLCLQEELHKELSYYHNGPALECLVVEEIAFKTHSRCYNEADLCGLKLSELLEIFGVIKFKDLFKELRYSDGGMLRLINTCFKRHFF